MSERDLRHIDRADAGDGAHAWHLLAVGDLCVTPGGVGDAGDSARIGGRLADVIAGSEIAVANLEGAIAGDRPIGKSGPAVSIDPRLPSWARERGFDLVTLANNHIMDWGEDGLWRTVAACDAAGLRHCGAGANGRDAVAPAELLVGDGVRLAIFSLCEREFGVAGGDASGAAWIGDPAVIACVREAAARNDVVIVFAHGGVEEVPLPPPERRDQLRALVDAGATAVIGHHPHVPQGWERYGAGIIAYSVGNFLFDYPEGARYPKTEWGIALDLSFDGAVLAGMEVIPIERTYDEGLSPRTVREVDDPIRSEAMLAHLHEVSAIMADPDLFERYWQATARHLWRTRYRRWLQRASGVHTVGNVRSQARDLMAALRRRFLPGRASAGPADSLPALGNPLMLLNLVRNESHRWCIERALAIESGDEPDRTTPEVERGVWRLMDWTEDR